MKSRSLNKDDKDSKKDKSSRKQQQIEEQRRAADNKKNEILYIDGNLAFRDFDENAGVFIMDDGTICDCVEILTKDLESISDDQLTRDILSWDRLYKTYAGDLKIYSFAFPTDVKSNRNYFEYKISRTENPAMRKRLQEELENIKGVGRNFPARAYVLMFYGKNAAEYQNNLITIFSSLNRGGSQLVRKIANDRKIAYVKQLLNKNMMGE